MTDAASTRAYERQDDRGEDRDGDEGLVRLCVFVVGVMTLGFVAFVTLMVTT